MRVIQPTEADPFLYKGRADGDDDYILVFVEDLLVAAKTPGGLRKGTRAVLGSVKARDLGQPTYFLELHVDRRGDTGTNRVGQRQYAVTLLERFGLAAANPARLQMKTGCS